MSDIMSAFSYDVKPGKTMRDPGNCSNPAQTKSKPEYFLIRERVDPDMVRQLIDHK
jgi:hypothetical protein